jgi:hypothetical protein
MLKLRVVQARFGDCLIVESGSGKRRKHVLIDGGPGRVYEPFLRKELARIAGEGGQVDLMVLSHVDNDHVLGLLELMTELKETRSLGSPGLPGIRRIWHNAFQEILPEAGEEAAMLEEIVLQRPVGADELPASAAEELPGERSLEEPPEALPELESPSEPAGPPETAPGGAGDLAPGGEPAPESEPAIDEGPIFALDPDLDLGIGEGVRLQLANELLGIPRNAGFRQGLITLEQARRPERIGSLRLWVLGPTGANLEELREKWLRWLDDRAGRVSFGVGEPVVEPDDSINNLSSIMLLAEAGGKRILLTGDGRSQDIVAGLEQAGLMEADGTCHVDVMKVPHHGSARNVVGELFDRVTADSYVFSADGRHGNPDWQTLVWLVEAVNRQGRAVRFYATNWTASLRRLVKERPGERNHYTLTVLEEGESVLVIPLG